MIGFAKYHGCGNSFVIVREKELPPCDFSTLALHMCNSATGIGADGLIVVREEPALEMIFYNMDGSRAPMCGNGIRCFAAYCVDKKISPSLGFSVVTLAGTVDVKVVNTDPYMIRIGMGRPDFSPSSLGIDEKGDDFLRRTLHTDAGDFTVSSCFMGTVHTVVWTDEFPDEHIASQISEHPIFTEKTNVNFVKVIDPAVLRIKTYERGVGFTPACGTGACASLVLGIEAGKTYSRVKVLLPYGTLTVEQTEEGEVMMTGPAVKTAEGIYIQEEI